MMARFAALVASSLAAGPAFAQNMNAEEARRFMTGKLFAVRCVAPLASASEIEARLKGQTFERSADEVALDPKRSWRQPHWTLWF